MKALEALAQVAREIREDVKAARDRDPAARAAGTAEIVLSYPGVHALLAHRVCHALHRADVPIAPRVLANVSRALTNIEIHPAARIGHEFFIDHGAGVVIGETAEIGDRVTLYQGVTLGGTGFASGKRHPTVQDNVTIGSGAKLLGPDHRRPRGEGRRELRRDPRRAAERDRRREPRPSGARGRRPAGGPRRRLGSPAGPGRGRHEGDVRPDRRARAADRGADRQRAQGAGVGPAAAARKGAEPCRRIAPRRRGDRPAAAGLGGARGAAAGGPQPAAARGGDVRERAAARPGRSRLRQDARAHAPDRAPGGDRAGAAAARSWRSPSRTRPPARCASASRRWSAGWCASCG